ncbi:MAG: UDP-N-acetylmuramate dehydrogenase [Alphaproteobacteria bacterium]|nr:UDP-N-acetylmuramate dehydrogenase [Alphaproteobacteria bacterium]
MKDLPKVKGELLENYELASLTRFKTGGVAEIYFSPRDVDDLTSFLKKAPKDMPIHVIGFGSNILIRDGVLNGIVIRLQNDNFSKIEKIDDITLKCGAFASSIAVSKFCAENGIAGMEFLFGIPGTIGGAILSNAGCFDREIKDIIVSFEAVDKLNGKRKIFTVDECGFAYRKSNISSRWIFTSVIIKGNTGKKEEILEKMDKIKEKKDSSQPTYTKTSGSTFKNPSKEHPAWKLIKESGCQGMKLGGAIVSPVHANFIVNEDNATSADIEDLAEQVRLKVYEKFGIMLEYEIKIIGSRKLENP